MAGEGGLEGVGEFPAELAAEASCEVGDGLRDFEEWKEIQKPLGFSQGRRIAESDENLGSGDDSHSFPSDFREVLSGLRGAIEAVYQYRGIETYVHGR